MDTANTAENTNDLARRRRVLDLAHTLADQFKQIGAEMNELREIGIPTPEWVDLMFGHFDPRHRESLGSALDAGVPMFIDNVIEWVYDDKKPDTQEMMDVGVDLGAAASRRWGFDIDRIMKLIPVIIGLFKKEVPVAPLGYYPGDPLYRGRMEFLIARLFAAAPQMTDASGHPVPQAPALECNVLLKGASAGLAGSLSTTPEGTLRMLCPTEMTAPRGQAPKMLMVEHFFDIDQVLDIAIIREVTTSGGTNADRSPIIHTS